jgi:hypothetical protein
LNKSSKELNLPSCNYWIFPSSNISKLHDNIFSSSSSSFDISKPIADQVGLYIYLIIIIFINIIYILLFYRTCFVSFPSAKETFNQNENQNKSVCVAILPVPFSW